MVARRDFCKLCWRRISNGNFYKHQMYLHIWCGHCRAPFWDTLHKTRAHMKDKTCCAASAHCMRCNETWDIINKNGKPDEHLATCTSLRAACEDKRACTYGCGRWLVGVEDAERHTVECAEKMGQKRVYKAKGGENEAKVERKTVPRNNHAQEERERIFGVLKGCLEKLPPGCRQDVHLAVIQELGQDNDHPLGLRADAMMNVFHRFDQDIKDAQETMKGMKNITRPHKDSQMSLDHATYTGVLAAAQVGTPLLAREYLERLPKTFDGPDEFEPGDWVVCTVRQALILLMCHHPVRPILVLGGVDDPLSEDVCMRKLEDTSRQTYEIHDLTKKNPAKKADKADDKQQTMDPAKMPFKTFLSVKESQARPLNMLSLPPFRSAAPAFLAQPNYDLVNTCIPESAGGGKHPNDGVRDCASFGLCALRGAMSVWHIDQHGFDTAAVCEFGRKLWVLLPGMPLDKCAAYARQMYTNREGYVGPEEEPGWPVVGVPLRAGDVLIQPAGTLHAPYSVSRAVGFSGYMMWGMMGMVKCVRVIRLGLNEDASNEDAVEGLVEKLLCVADCWARALREKKVGWPGGEELKLFRAEIKELQEEMLQRKRKEEEERRALADAAPQGTEGQELSVADQLKQLEQKLKDVEAENKLNKQMRARAETTAVKLQSEVDNYKKRDASEREDRAAKRRRGVLRMME